MMLRMLVVRLVLSYGFEMTSIYLRCTPSNRGPMPPSMLPLLTSKLWRIPYDTPSVMLGPPMSGSASPYPVALFFAEKMVGGKSWLCRTLPSCLKAGWLIYLEISPW